MGWRFRKSFRVIPGVRLNLSRRGLSATVGAGPLSMGIGSRGIYANASIPGTGLSYRKKLTGPIEGVPTTDTVPPPDPQEVRLPIYDSAAETTAVRSQSTEAITSESLASLRRLIQDAHKERSDITNELRGAETDHSTAEARFRSWDRGFLFRRLFPGKFKVRSEALGEATAKRDELAEQLRLTTIATEIEINPEQAEPYFRMRDEFAGLLRCRYIWDTLCRQPINQTATRSAAAVNITREPVTFSLRTCELIQWAQKVPHLGNRNGGDLYLFPGFVLFGDSRDAFALIDFRDISLTFEIAKVLDEGIIPDDSKVIGQTWAKVNKNGKPDLRFKDNYTIPIVGYGMLQFRSASGLNEEYQFSNAALAERFAVAWREFHASYG